MSNRKFEYDREGFLEAREYLISIDELHMLEKELSTDGFTLVHLANSIWEERNKETYDWPEL